MAVKKVPDGYHAVTPYLVVKGAAKALEFYEKAFGGQTLLTMPGPDGRLGHAEIKLGDSVVMLADEHPERGIKSAEAFGGSPVSLMLYVEDVDRTVARAVELGAKVTRPIANQFYGDRLGVLVDPFGLQWSVATHVEDVSPEEMERRAKAQQG